MHKISRNKMSVSPTLIDLGDAVVQTKGLAQVGQPDTLQGQRFPIPGLAND